MGLSFAEKLFFFTKKIDFLKIRYKTAQYFNLGHAHAIARSEFFSRPFPFSRAFLMPLATFYVLFHKTLGANYGQSLEWDLDQL